MSVRPEEHPKGSGKWRVRPRVGGRLRNVIAGVSFAEADEAARAYEQLRNAKAMRDGLTLSQFGLGFLDRRERRGLRGIDRDRSRWSTYIDGDTIGALPISTLGRRDVLDWLDRRSALSYGTQCNALNLLRVALQEAVDRELLPANPARDVRVHRAGAAKETDDLEGILSPDEQRALLYAVPERERDLVIFALYTGMRRGSQWFLRAEDCHGDHVFIRRHKSGRPRTLHLLAPARDALARSLMRGREWAFPSVMGMRRLLGPPPRGWHAWVRSAGIKRRVRWHDLRHTCATSLLAGWWGRKWTLDEVCGYLGHSTVRVTERYARKLAESQAKAVSETKFPGGDGGGGNGAGSHISDTHCKTVIRGFESRPHLRSNNAESVDGAAVAGELPGDFHAPAPWALALAAECALTRRVFTVPAVRFGRKGARRA